MRTASQIYIWSGIKNIQVVKGMIRYLDRNADDITQYVEIDLTRINEPERKHLKRKLNQMYGEYKDIIKYENGDGKLVYKTEVLVPKVRQRDRLNLLMVLGNPATHSVQSSMFFAYERRRSKQGIKKWIEHRFWTALRDCKVLTFYKDIPNPTPDNIEDINRYKRHCLLNGTYESDFNIFILPYFSFPTPSSRGASRGVKGIESIVGKTIFAEMKGAEFYRFAETVASNEMKNIICFNKTIGCEILRQTKFEKKGIIHNQPVYIINDAFKGATLYHLEPTRLIHTQTGKKILKRVVSAILSRGVS
jgi:hypothetical protein